MGQYAVFSALLLAAYRPILRIAAVVVRFVEDKLPHAHARARPPLQAEPAEPAATLDER